MLNKLFLLVVCVLLLGLTNCKKVNLENPETSDALELSATTEDESLAEAQEIMFEDDGEIGDEAELFASNDNPEELFKEEPAPAPQETHKKLAKVISPPQQSKVVSAKATPAKKRIIAKAKPKKHVARQRISKKSIHHAPKILPQVEQQETIVDDEEDVIVHNDSEIEVVGNEEIVDSQPNYEEATPAPAHAYKKPERVVAKAQVRTAGKSNFLWLSILIVCLLIVGLGVVLFLKKRRSSQFENIDSNIDFHASSENLDEASGFEVPDLSNALNEEVPNFDEDVVTDAHMPMDDLAPDFQVGAEYASAVSNVSNDDPDDSIIDSLSPEFEIVDEIDGIESEDVAPEAQHVEYGEDLPNEVSAVLELTIGGDKAVIPTEMKNIHRNKKAAKAKKHEHEHEPEIKVVEPEEPEIQVSNEGALYGEDVPNEVSALIDMAGGGKLVEPVKIEKGHETKQKPEPIEEIHEEIDPEPAVQAQSGPSYGEDVPNEVSALIDMQDGVVEPVKMEKIHRAPKPKETLEIHEDIIDEILPDEPAMPHDTALYGEDVPNEVSAIIDMSGGEAINEEISRIDAKIEELDEQLGDIIDDHNIDPSITADVEQIDDGEFLEDLQNIEKEEELEISNDHQFLDDEEFTRSNIISAVVGEELDLTSPHEIIHEEPELAASTDIIQDSSVTHEEVNSLSNKIAESVLTEDVPADYSKYMNEQMKTQEQAQPEHAKEEIYYENEETISSDVSLKKSDLVDLIAAKFSFPKTKAQKAINEVFNIMTTGLKKEGDLRFRELFHLSVKKNKKRMARNPKTGKSVTIPAKKVVQFKMGKELFELINKK